MLSLLPSSLDAFVASLPAEEDALWGEYLLDDCVRRGFEEWPPLECACGVDPFTCDCYLRGLP